MKTGNPGKQRFGVGAVRVSIALWVAVLLFGGMTGCATLKARWKGDASLLAGREFEEARIRLREAVITRDPSSFADVSSADFSWRLGVPPEGETAFEYWDRYGGWLILDRLLKSPFKRAGETLVSPVEAVDGGYKGPKLVLKKVGKEWLMTSFTLGVNEGK
jgi:hypothetical protein